jgi:excisionase family DNA binding protein
VIDEEFMTTTEVARICSVTSYTVRRWITEGKLPAVKLGSAGQANLRIKRSDLLDFLQQRNKSVG